jgi:anaphase-promoting complex subunit 10
MAGLPGATLDIDHDFRELGHLAVWNVSSAKPGNGVELLRDGNKDTYWQSDGTQPHLVDIQFQKKMYVQVCL